MRYLRRDEAAAYIRNNYGIPCERSTLASWVSKGKGPPFYKPSKTITLYDQKELDKWARSLLGITEPPAIGLGE